MQSVSTLSPQSHDFGLGKMREFYEKWEDFVRGLLVGLNPLPLSPFQGNKNKTIFKLKVTFRALYPNPNPVIKTPKSRKRPSSLLQSLCL